VVVAAARVVEQAGKLAKRCGASEARQTACLAYQLN